MQVNLKGKREYFVLLAVVLIGCLILYSPFISGELSYLFYGDANDDTFQAHLPMYQAIIEKIADRDFSPMDFTWCAGESLFGWQFVMFDPFALPIYIVGLLLGTSVVPKLLIWVQVLRVMCAGVACDYFLRCFQLNPKARIIASICYAFSAFMVGGIGQQYMFATAPVLFALMLAFLEKSTQNSRYLIAFSLCVAVVGIWSAYFCYMMLLTCGLYAVMRFWSKTEKITWKSMVNWFGPLLAGAVVGLMLSAIVFLPTAYILLFSSDRMAARTSFREMFSLKSVQQLKTTFLRLFTEQAEGTMNNWGGYQSHFNSPHLYFSPLLVAAAPQYLFSIPKMRKKEREVAIAAGFLMALAFFTPVVGVAYNAFTYHMARYVFVMLPFFALMIAGVITSAEKKQFFSYPAAALSIAAVLFATWLYRLVPAANRQTTQMATIFSFAAVLIALLYLYFLSCGRSGWRRYTALVSVLVIFSAILLEGWTGLYTDRNSPRVESMDWLYQNEGIQWIHQLHKENGSQFYRTERVITGWGHWPMFSSSLAFEYCSVTGYNSVINKKMVSFCDMFGKNIRRDGTMGLGTTVTYTYGALGRTWDWCMADLLGIRYILSNYPVEEPEWELIYGSSDYGIELMYQNPRVQTIGAIYYGWYPEDQVSDWAFDNQMMLPFAVSLDHAAENVPLVNHPEIRYDALDTDPILVAAQSDMESCPELVLDSFEHQENERSWLSFKIKGNAGTSLVCAVDTGFGYSSEYWSNGIYTLSEDEMTVLLALPNDIQKVGFYVDGPQREDVTVSDFELVTTMGKNYTTKGIDIQSVQQSGELWGTVQMEQDGILVLPVFIQDGWHLEVDGEERDIWLANTALCAAELTAGTHSIRMWYEVPWGNLGMVVSVLGLCGLAAMFLLIKRQERHRKRE